MDKIQVTFINNNKETGAQYDVTLAASDGTVEFIHTDLDAITAECYTEDADADTEAEINALIANKKDTCYKDSTADTKYSYNSIKYNLYNVTDDLSQDQKTGFNTLDKATIKGLISDDNSVDDGLVQHGSTKAIPQTLAAGEVIAADGTEYYVLEIEYANVAANQNIENLAALNMFVSIK